MSEKVSDQEKDFWDSAVLPEHERKPVSELKRVTAELAALREQLTLTEESNAGLSSTISADVIAYRKIYDELAALREELAASKRNEHNSEVAYKAAIEKQEELRDRKNSIVDLQQRLTAAEQRNSQMSGFLERMLKGCGNDLLAAWQSEMEMVLTDAALKPTESGASE